MRSKREPDIQISTESFLEIAGVMFVALNARGEVILINRRGCHILGYPEKEIIGKNWFDHFLPRKNRKAVKKIYQELMTGRIKEFEFHTNPVVNQKGEERIISFHNTILRNKQGRITGTLSSAEDVTERENTRRRSAENQNFLTSVFDAIQDGISVLETDFTIVRVNRWMEKMYVSQRPIVGKKCYQVYQQRKSPCPWCPSIKTLKTGKLNAEIVPYPSSKNPRGWIELSSYPLKNLQGQVAGIIEHVKDVTDQKNSQDALRESEEKYRQLIQHSSDSIYLLYNRKFEIVNDKFQKMFGVSREELDRPDFDFMDLVAPKSRALVEERQKRLNRGEELESNYEFTALTGKGREVEVEASVSYISYKDGMATQGILRDITERKRLENQLRQALKMEAIGRLAGGVAHDFNNLLTVISGYCEMMLLRNLPDQFRGDLRQIQKASEKAMRLTGQLLTFSRKQLIKPEILDVNTLIGEHLKMLDRLLGEHIKIETGLSRDLGLVRVDRGQMEQIIMNVEVNAREAMPDGGSLIIETANVEFDESYQMRHAEARPGPYVMLSISDTGSGMDGSTLSRIFEPFFTTKNNEKGSGLGLSTVYGIVKQNDGFIYAYSEPQQGTTFKLYFPRVDKPPGSEEQTDSAHSGLSGEETILLVEDDSSVREITRSALSSYSYKVLVAGSGRQAMNLFRRHQGEIGLLLADVVMPNMSGKELAEKLLAMNPRLKVLFYSGYTDNTIAHHGILDPRVEFIQKPFSYSDLARKVRKILGGA